MATDAIQLTAAVANAWAIYFDHANQTTFNPTLNSGAGGYEAWSDGHYSQYRIAMAQQGTSKRWTVVRPAGVAIPFDISVRQNVDGTLANDVPLSSVQSAVDAVTNRVPQIIPFSAGGYIQTDIETLQGSSEGLDGLNLLGADYNNGAGLITDGMNGAIQAAGMSNKFDTMITLSGSAYMFTAPAVANVPAGSNKNVDSRFTAVRTGR